MECASLEDLLRIWDLEQYISAFKSNCIETNDLQTLFEPEWKDTLQSLIPIVGHRIKFIKNVKQFIEVKSDSNEDTKITHKNVRDEITTSFSPKPSTSDLSLPENFPKPSKILKSTSSRKKSIESNESNAILGEQLRLLLSKSATGRCILQLAKQRPYLKYDKDRNRLTDIIIENELSKSEKISSAYFIELVRAIQYIFPEEDSEIYFIPYKKTCDGRKLSAKGKLISKYYSIRKEFKALGVIQTKIQSESNSGDDSGDDSELNENLQDKLKFLEENIEPWPTIVQYWTDTFKYRITELHEKSRVVNRNKRSNKGKASVKGKIKSVIPEKIQTRQEKKNELENVSTYMNKYEALRQKNGYTLFQIDFDLLYPEQKLKTYSCFGNFCDRIVQALNDEESKCEALKDNLLLLKDEISEETKNLVVLLSLCYLDTVVTVAHQFANNKMWRPSLTEIQEGVISHVTNVTKLQSFVEERQKKLTNWGLTVKPYVLACGSSVADIDAYYVIVDTKTKFISQSSVRALDLCFKIIHAAHLEYSAESYRLWRLIQKELYELTTVFDEWKSDAQLPKLFQKLSRK